MANLVEHPDEEGVVRNLSMSERRATCMAGPDDPLGDDVLAAPP
ncbi:hypothetical protein [Streptomyces sp. NPDC058252]